jgi:DNA-binding NarL/FixJ family response regulator
MAGRTISELVEVVTGVEAIRHRFAQVQHAPRSQVRSFVTKPFVAVPPGANPVESQMVAALLLAGLTDQAVASQLDLSLRTLQRRLRHLMDAAGVQSRMQLGWYAARHDWA